VGEIESLNGFRLILETLSENMAVDHGEEAVASLLVASASAIARSNDLPVEIVEKMYRQQITRYSESASSKAADFPSDALVVRNRSVN